MTALNTFIFGQQRYRVTAAAVMVRLSGGGGKDVCRYVYRGGALPATTSPLQIQRLLRKGMIEEVTTSERS